MSLNTVIAFALLLKKITRKGSMGKKNFTQRMRRNTTTAAATSKKKTSSISSCSSSDLETEEDEYCSPQEFHTISNSNNNKKSSLIVTPPSIKSLRHSQIKVFSSSVTNSDIVLVSTDELQTEQKLTSSLSLILPPPPQQQIVVRDFAYPPDSPLHFGKNAYTALDNQSAVSLSSPDFNGRDARALFDFTPETEYEIGLKAGQSVWVQYRQCQGWLIADVQDETGLIPESYVEFI